MAKETRPKGIEEAAGTEEAAGKAGQPEAAAPKFLVGKLRKNCLELFNITTSTFDGAMYGIKETELGIEEAKAIIDNFLYGGKK